MPAITGAALLAMALASRPVSRPDQVASRGALALVTACATVVNSTGSTSRTNTFSPDDVLPVGLEVLYRFVTRLLAIHG